MSSPRVLCSIWYGILNLFFWFLSVYRLLSLLEFYYNADPSKQIVAATVPASEHSVECTNAFYGK